MLSDAVQPTPAPAPRGAAGTAAPDAPWYAAGLRFTCTQCGNCCGGPPGHVWLNADEIQAMARRLGMTAEEFEQQHTRRIGARRSLLERRNGDCEFLARDGDGKARCTVYEARPVQCRTWPFWEGSLRSRRSWEVAARDCPGMNQGQLHPLPVIQTALRRNAAAGLPL